MSKVFVEYAIKPAFRDSFLIYMQEWQRREGRFGAIGGNGSGRAFCRNLEGSYLRGVSYFETRTLAWN